jgi:hypothetical protein
VTEPLVEVPAAVAGSWHDAIPAIAAGALEQLRVSQADVDATRIARKAPAACQSVDQYLDLRLYDHGLTVIPGRVVYTLGGIPVASYAAGMAPADVLEAAVILTVELYRRKDAAYGVLPGAGDLPVRISADHMRGVASLLDPYREGWGIG